MMLVRATGGESTGGQRYRVAKFGLKTRNQYNCHLIIANVHGALIMFHILAKF